VSDDKQAEAAAFARGAAAMQRRAIAACEACASDCLGAEDGIDADEEAQLAVAACVAAVRVAPWPTMTANDAPTPAWGPLPTAAEVDAHVARSSPARASDGAPWAYRCADSSGDYVAIIYLRTEKDEVTSCEPGHAVWYRLRAWHRKSQWRPVDGDGMPVERVR
jgi:hypothetical protein